MTPLQLLYVAAATGAILFFAAGAATMALRRRPALLEVAVPDRIDREHVAAVETYELDMQRVRAERAEAANAPLELELERLRGQLATSRDNSIDARLLEASSQIEHHRRMASAFEERAKQLGVELDRARSEAAAATNRCTHLGAELERAHSGAAVAVENLVDADARAGEAERLLAERSQTARDLAAKSELLEARLRDAEALRAEYVRLRTSVTESSFLKSEVARLEERIRSMQRDAIAPPRRLPRSSQRPSTQAASGTVADSLSAAIERFADANTRSIAIADTIGFPLATSGDDGSALAAYAALLVESANRAAELLPVAAPMAIELIDERGARVSVWTFEVERERLLLVNLAVGAVDQRRVDVALADFATILAPSIAR